MNKYYYWTGHDWTNGNVPEAFIGYKDLEELANQHYDGDILKAKADDEYVFTANEYREWIEG